MYTMQTLQNSLLTNTIMFCILFIPSLDTFHVGTCQRCKHVFNIYEYSNEVSHHRRISRFSEKTFSP